MSIINRLVHYCIFFALPILFACGRNNQQSGGAANAEVKEFPVLTIVPRTATLNNEFPATIEGQQDIEIRPKIDGYIEEIYVDEGATVRKNQKLFRIRAPQYEQEVRTAEANIKIAQADVNTAQMEVNKVRPLVEKGIISKYELESSQFNLESRRAALAQARAALANARTNLSYTLITSPANGIIGTIPYKIGSLVSSNTANPLTTVSNTGNIYAYFSINEKDALEFSQTRRGATTEERLATMPPVSLILANGLLYPEKGRIETTSGNIDTETGSIRVRATFPNPRNIVRSGSSGTIRIPSTIDSALLVPQKSTYEIQGKTFAYLVEGTGTVRSVELNVLEGGNGQFFVVREGVKTGDKVVLEGVASLREGLEIKPREVKADSVFQQASQ